MEHLDSKYFERVITALKEAKAQQNIEINEQFRQSLRVGLTEKASLLASPEVPGWADLVLRNKYLFGGVPVFAALVLVTMAALNHQVPVVNNQVITETPTSDRQNDLATDVMRDLNNENNVMTEGLGSQNSSGVTTFSADLVMPPADVLAARERFLRGESDTGLMDDSGLQLSSGTDAEGYVFLENNSTSLKVPATVLPAVSSDEEMPITSGKGSVVPEPLVVKTEPTMVAPVDVPTQSVVVKPVVPVEHNGQVTAPTTTSTTPVAPVEGNGKVILEPTYQEPVVDSTVKKTTTTTATPTVAQPVQTVVPALTTTTTPAPTVTTTPTEVKSLSVPVVLPSGQATEVQTLSTDYLNTVELRTEVAPKITVNYALTDMMAVQTLEAKRVYYSGENRDQLVAIVLDGLKSRTANLSRDYYVNIVKFVDGTYRATLYEYGKATQLMVIAEQRGGLKIVTEVVY